MVNIKIKEIPKNDRPRERLLNNGAESLSNEELLAIILDTGSKDVSVKSLALNILKKCDDFKDLRNINLETLLSIKGIGRAKACKILALVEIAKRLNKKIQNINNLRITNSDIVYEYYKNIFDGVYQEQFRCVYLDNNKRIIKEKLLFVGTINHSLVHPREIFKEAYLVNATCIICVHNHPSGNVIPSIDDINITKRLVEIGNLLGIKVLDHIIIGIDKYYSFLQNGDIV